MKKIKQFYQKCLDFWHIEEEGHYLNLGIKIFLVFFVAIILWISIAPLNSSVITSGEIILTSSKKTISHLEGGIIQEIKVKEGQFVEEGQDLIALNTIQVQSKITQISENIKAAEFQKTAMQNRIKTLQQELKIVNQLLKDENSSLTRKLEIEKQLYESQGRFGEIITNIASLKDEFIANQYILERSVIKAPVTGFVMNLKYQTIGGTITPASEIMFIIPKDDKMVAEVKAKPQDIDLLREGLVAKVQLSAYKTRLIPKLEGRVINVSADSFKNEMNGEIYFKARIEIPESELTKLKMDVVLSPGMPVNAFIITGSRTFLQYLMSPISESAYRAFREE